jgi:hypothetical protein
MKWHELYVVEQVGSHEGETVRPTVEGVADSDPRPFGTARWRFAFWALTPASNYAHHMTVATGRKHAAIKYVREERKKRVKKP